jgi:Skp family chaperone for outer membrane proteins
MTRIACIAAVCTTLGTLGLLAGCDTAIDPAGTASASNIPAAPGGGAAAVGGVAVIDLDEVAKRMGDDLKIVNTIKQHESQLNESLQALQVSYTQQLENKRRAYGYKPSEEQERELQQLDVNLGTKLQEAQLSAQRELAVHQNSLVSRLREQVRPVARDVAKSRGLSTIVVKNLDVLFHYDPAQDITDEVIGKLLAHGGGDSTEGSHQQSPPSAESSGDPQPFPYTAEQPRSLPR